MNLSEKERKALADRYGDLKLEGGFNSRLKQTIVTIKEVKKELGLKDSDIADMFGYKNVNSYRNSGGKPSIENGIVSFYLKMKSKMKD